MIALAGTGSINNTSPARGMKLQEHNELAVLIRDCKASSRIAQKKLYDLYAPSAYGTIRRYLYNHDDAAQEILNDAFYKVLTKLEQYSFQGSFEGWVRRIVVNTITDHLRKNVKDAPIMKEIQPEDAYTGSNSLDTLSHKDVLKVVQTLPEMQLAVFNLFVFDDYPHKEIATMLNISENNSRWYLNDARRRLKEKLNFFMK